MVSYTISNIYIYIGNHMVDFTRKEKVIPLVGDVGVYIYNGNRVKSSFLFWCPPVKIVRYGKSRVFGMIIFRMVFPMCYPHLRVDLSEWVSMLGENNQWSNCQNLGKSDGFTFYKTHPTKTYTLARDQETTKNRDVPFGNGMDISQKLPLENEG